VPVEFAKSKSTVSNSYANIADFLRKLTIPLKIYFVVANVRILPSR
jgi:hypothetical protein